MSNKNWWTRSIEWKFDDEEDLFPRAITMTVDGRSFIFQRADEVSKLMADARERATYEQNHGEPDPGDEQPQKGPNPTPSLPVSAIVVRPESMPVDEWVAQTTAVLSQLKSGHEWDVSASSARVWRNGATRVQFGNPPLASSDDAKANPEFP